MKPIRLTEFGCPAVDCGGNSPNLFQDPKSAEGALPPYSSGARDDRMQRRVLEAVLAHFGRPENNPVSPVYGGPMLDGADAWCWDARPFPAFPARADVWADAGAWQTGHWLNGRLNGEAADILAAILERGGLGEDGYEIGETDRTVEGFVIGRPMTTRAALAPLLTALGMVSAERRGRVALIGREAPAGLLENDGLALPDDGDARIRTRTTEPTPRGARVRFIDEAASYQTGSVTVRGAGDGPMVDMDLPAVCSAALAEAVAKDALEVGADEGLTLHLGPVDGLGLETGDSLRLGEEVWRIDRVDYDETPKALLSRLLANAVGEVRPIWRDEGVDPAVGAPFLAVLDLPPLPGQEADNRPVVAVAAEPWRPMSVWAGGGIGSLSLRASVSGPAQIGRLVADLQTGVIGRWDTVNSLVLDVEGGAPSSLSAEAVLAGGNAIAVQTSEGWEVLQFRQASLIGGGQWRLSGLLRGLQGTEAATRARAEAGALAVFLDRNLPRAEVAGEEIGLPMVWTAGRRGGPGSGLGVSAVTMMRGFMGVRSARLIFGSPLSLRGAASAGSPARGWAMSGKASPSAATPTGSG